MNQPTDPRPVYAAATSWTASLMKRVSTDQLQNRTPCTELDVQALCGHLIGTARRAEGLAAGADIVTIDGFPAVHDARRYTDTVAHAIELWSDDAKLGAMVTVPWGTVPGAGALWGYVNETLVHGWDLAVAIGADPEADPEIVAPAHGVARQFISADIRADDAVPFGPVVEPRDGAGLTEQLANWSGRRSENWVGLAR